MWTIESPVAPNVEILGWLSSGEPVMGTVVFGTARIFVIGDEHPMLAVSQPFVDNLVNWTFPRKRGL